MNAETKIKAATTLLDALAKALPALGGAKKNANNPAFKSKYADLAAVIDAIRPVADHGVWFLQQSINHHEGALVETFFIGHGEKISAGSVFVPAAKSNAHGFGSALTYARRYGLQTAFGLPTEDDDGNAAASAPADPVSDSDAVLIKGYCKALGGSVGGDILRAYKIDKITQLTAGQAKAVIDKLADRVEEKAKAASNAEAADA